MCCLSATACQDVPSFGRWTSAALGYLIVMGLDDDICFGIGSSLLFSVGPCVAIFRQVALSISRLPHSDGFGIAFVLV